MKEKFRTRKSFLSIWQKFKDWLEFWQPRPTPTAFQKKLAAVRSVSFAYKQCSIFKQTKHMRLKVINVLWNGMCLPKQTVSHLPLWPLQKEKQVNCFRYSRQNNTLYWKITSYQELQIHVQLCFEVKTTIGILSILRQCRLDLWKKLEIINDKWTYSRC